jgi:hypothetical protein
MPVPACRSNSNGERHLKHEALIDEMVVKKFWQEALLNPVLHAFFASSRSLAEHTPVCTLSGGVDALFGQLP